MTNIHSDLVEQAIKLIDPSQGSPMADNIVTGGAGSKPLAHRFKESNALANCPKIAMTWFALGQRTTKIQARKMIVELAGAVYDIIQREFKIKKDEEPKIKALIIILISSCRVNEYQPAMSKLAKASGVDESQFFGGRRWSILVDRIKNIFYNWNLDVVSEMSEHNEKKRRA